VGIRTEEERGRRRLRLDHPVLRWLPEILAASEATGTPPSLIASVIEVESSGDPRAISPAGARGLMQIMPDEFHARSVPRARWHHPATNIYVGALILAERRALTGSWRGAVSRYFGIGCDAHGTCTSVYVRRVFAQVEGYAAIIREPRQSGFDILPTDWRPPR
jgi:soluble lytic murein transglycosylase-like protein